MSFSGLNPLQKAVMGRLNGDDVLLSMLPGGLHDRVPEEPQYPYAVYDDAFETRNDTFGNRGHDISVTISVWTADGSLTKQGIGHSGYDVGQSIVEYLGELLVNEHDPMVVDGHDVVVFELLSNTVDRDDDSHRCVNMLFNAKLEDRVD